jgi:hypothetical protein
MGILTPRHQEGNKNAKGDSQWKCLRSLWALGITIMAAMASTMTVMQPHGIAHARIWSGS